MSSAANNLLSICKTLEDGAFHAGSSIGQQLGITRAAVWKSIAKLQALGVAIQSIKGKGYALTQPLQLLSAQKIQQKLQDKNIALKIFDQVDSTNNTLKQAHFENKEIGVCLAERQTAGRGRLQRTWYSPFAQNIYASIRYGVATDVSELSGLSLVIGLATCKAIESVIESVIDPSLTLKTSLPCLQVKWPNDIILQQKKLSGILIEMQAEAHGFCQVIIGIGINVNMRAADNPPIEQAWTSLADSYGHYFDRNILVIALIKQVTDYMKKFTQHGLSYFMPEWEKRDYLHGKTINLCNGRHTQRGVCAGINHDGHLQLNTASKKILAFAAGDSKIIK